MGFVKREIIFSESVYSSFIKDDLFNHDLINYFTNEKNKNPKRLNTSAKGGYRSEDVPLNVSFIPVLKKHLYIFLKESFDIDNFKIQSAWFVENLKGHFNVKHNHPEAHLSGVYYLKAPKNCGDIVLFRDDKLVEYLDLYNYLEPNSDHYVNYSITPEKSKLIVFPAHLSHQVNPNQSDDARLCFGFNIKLFRKK